jgi:hypothetical protein
MRSLRNIKLKTKRYSERQMEENKESSEPRTGRHYATRRAGVPRDVFLHTLIDTYVLPVLFQLSSCMSGRAATFTALMSADRTHACTYGLGRIKSSTPTTIPKGILRATTYQREERDAITTTGGCCPT